ncbi:acetyl-CoA carboxylase biotin carboxyl carrier protein subunit [Bradyrhizobium sp. BWA-3-5]|uniref:acetyl-CoA carboxylase biotin carboxyl carrier protein n=1 Tax=Bradyrhizobium sp. BWA-3-5 TaxID=3080013 RepID=UPI00293EEAB6|nr:acetyl-CoA carboxylase biotin carboxyl carrier protein subunit [Bradyrhizobium sp. BWA-3-5]WOH63755.1 acetyl-CoA carboxylase biotin carboxyl carrier protein subunit [Bradyrhizobium sp. BWA-3-5]
MDLLAGCSLSEIEIEEGGVRVRIVKQRAAPNSRSHDLPLANLSAERTAEEDSESTTDETTIVSPMYATFYRASSPADAPFVQIGDAVTAGQTLAMLEAMKTLTPLLCELEGVVTAIRAQDGHLVDEGQPLFDLRRLDHV